MLEGGGKNEEMEKEFKQSKQGTECGKIIVYLCVHASECVCV